jgi:hypothetical protein
MMYDICLYKPASIWLVRCVLVYTYTTVTWLICDCLYLNLHRHGLCDIWLFVSARIWLVCIRYVLGCISASIWFGWYVLGCICLHRYGLCDVCLYISAPLWLLWQVVVYAVTWLICDCLYPRTWTAIAYVIYACINLHQYSLSDICLCIPAPMICACIHIVWYVLVWTCTNVAPLWRDWYVFVYTCTNRAYVI